MKTIPFEASPHQINWGSSNALKNHPVDILLSNSQNVKNKGEEEKVLREAPKDLASRIRSSLRKDNPSLKAEFDGRSQDIEVSMFQASMSKVYSVKEAEGGENLHSNDLGNDSIFGSNVGNTQNLGRKEFKTAKIPAGEGKKEVSELSFNMLENDDNKSDYNFLKV